MFTTENSHRFHIPVLGTGYTVDTPLKVARYGISSVMSIVDDVMIEEMREFHSRGNGIEFVPITAQEDDFRARRITAYLNLLDLLVKRQTEEMRALPFGEANDLATCFELLPRCPIRSDYEAMLATPAGALRTERETALRATITAGSLDVNIMTKLDRQRWTHGIPVDPWYSDATAALRGYAMSTVESSVVFSAGMNPRLFGSMDSYSDFFADEAGRLKKKITLKVGDYRSALIQGTLLAKKGLWTSEFRIESGLNCGGHAFAAKGLLDGPILEDFLEKRDELFEKLHAIYLNGSKEVNKPPADVNIRFTFQGGVGTAREGEFLLERYQVDRIGWGTPFMLVPEVVNLDREHRQRLCDAGSDDVFLSEASPLGVPFWNLRTSSSEEARRRRITEKRPGVACRKKFLAFNNEFTEEPACTASHSYQKRKLEEIGTADLSDEARTRLREGVLAKVCLCMDLSATVTKAVGIHPEGTPAITAGPNIVNFSRIISLGEMVSHIYGRLSLISTAHRPHHFIRGIEIYLDSVRNELSDTALDITQKGEKYFVEIRKNLLAGIEYYRALSESFIQKEREGFLARLETLKNELLVLLPEPA